MNGIEMRGMDELSQRLQEILSQSDEMLRTFHGEIADILKVEVDRAISASGLKDSQGKVKSWQESRVGTRGGYAAISAQKGQTGPNSPGAITNYLENGHRIRRPSGLSKDYRPRINVPYVDGFHFYESARRTAKAKIILKAEQFTKQMAERLGGNG